jgi:hypothetical protein
MSKATRMAAKPIPLGAKAYLLIEACFWILFFPFLDVIPFPLGVLVFLLFLILAGWGWFIWQEILRLRMNPSSKVQLSQRKAEPVMPRGVWDRELDG